IRRRLAENQLDAGDFEAFPPYAERGLRPTSGFGIGIERLMRYITGQRDIRQIRPFPKVPGKITM
ncbi:MAG: amino acid--tRNA ligase-related protein, partial [Bacillota bacterium]